MTENELKRIIELFGNNVFQTAFCYMKSYADAEDIREEAFIKLYLSGKSFDSGHCAESIGKAGGFHKHEKTRKSRKSGTDCKGYDKVL